MIGDTSFRSASNRNRLSTPACKNKMGPIEKEAATSGKRARYPKGANFAQLLRWHMDFGTRPTGDPDRTGKRWDVRSLAEKVTGSRTIEKDYIGVTPEAVRTWLKQTRPGDCESIALALFGTNPLYEEWRVDFFDAYRRLPERGGGRRKADGLAPGPSAAIPDGVPALDLYELDALPENAEILIDRVAYGRGAHGVQEAAERLLWLGAGTGLLDDRGDYLGTTRFCPPSRAACEALAKDRAIFWPRQFRVIGSRPTQWVAQLYIVTDMAYPSGIAYPGRPEFELSGILGIEGPRAFTDPAGQPLRRGSLDIGEGLGCAAVVTVVAFENGRPRSRSRHFVIVRKGNLRPNDYI